MKEEILGYEIAQSGTTIEITAANTGSYENFEDVCAEILKREQKLVINDIVILVEGAKYRVPDGLGMLKSGTTYQALNDAVLKGEEYQGPLRAKMKLEGLSEQNLKDVSAKALKKIQGKVKWFSVEKGYGFIVSDQGEEHHFSVRDVKGADLPQNGDVVSFESRTGNKGPKAVAVSLVSRATAPTSGRSDDRVACPHCGKKMVPRIITDRGSLSKSVCPFCGGTYKDFGWCFIATAVYGDSQSPEVVALRQFRDQNLRSNLVGRAFIRSYYHLSPPVARYLSQKPRLAASVRSLLDAFLRWRG